MRVRLVIDVLNGRVVRGVAGRRDEYRPIESVLTDSTAPLDVAQAFRDGLGITAIYVADLDGLVNQRANLDLLSSLVDDGFDVLADVGVRRVGDAECLSELGVQGIVAALESVPSADVLTGLFDRLGPDRLVFSLDLQNGRTLRASDDWPDSPSDVVRSVLEIGLRRMIVLDLAAVGVGTGVPTLDLCRWIRELAPSAELATGGGVRTNTDLDEIRATGVAEALVASAVHDGTLGRGALR